MKRIFYFTVLLSFVFLNVTAQINSTDNSSFSRPKIIQHIENNSNVKVKQDASLDRLMNKYINRVEKEDLSGPYSGPGYRIQVFSSNAQRTAKNESYRVELKLRSAFPDYHVYRIFSSPFWKVRIGDFRTSEDAQSFRKELLKTFPELRKETYTVREKRVTIR